MYANHCGTVALNSFIAKKLLKKTSKQTNEQSDSIHPNKPNSLGGEHFPV